MIIGMGIDLVEVARIDKILDRYGLIFIKKILTSNEMELLPLNRSTWLAGRFAAKEACVKALGTGFSNGITFYDFEILNNNCGRPYIKFYNKAKKMAKLLQIKKASISITHERSMAAAVVILE